MALRTDATGQTTVSVIVPHYNRPDMVGRALESIQRQTLPATEVLLVDDQSTAENRAKLQPFTELAKLLSTPRNMGLSGARNFGAQHATGTWLAFLDDDDEYVPAKLQAQIEYLQQHPEVHALGGGLTMIAADGSTEYWGGKPTRRLELADALRHTASMAQALIIRREVFLELGGFDTSLRSMEDYELGIRVLANGFDMHFLAEPMFLYYFGGGRDQLTRNWKRMIGSELRVIHKHAGAARATFGTFGEVRLIAGCLRKWGRRRGRVLGRLTWLSGVALEKLFGRVPGLTT